MATVKLMDVSKSRGDQIILHGLDLSIEKGEFVVVVGPSGCGKSTLLRLVAGLETLSSGQILINDRCVNQIAPAERDMAMVFQHYALYPHMTVYQNMAYGLKIRGFDKALINARVKEVSALLHLDACLYRKPSALSGGQRQRVAMGRAIVRSPAVFLFDEPLSNLDAKLRAEMRYELKKLHQDLKATSLYVTHDQTEAMTLADRVVVLNAGRIEQVGTPRAIYERPASLFVAGFMGHYPMNCFRATINAKQTVLLTDLGVELSLPALSQSLPSGHAVILAIRPEHLYLASGEAKDLRFEARVERVEDMGLDKLIHLRGLYQSAPMLVRVLGDVDCSRTQYSIGMDLKKANLYCQTTGLFLGGWDATTNTTSVSHS